MKRITIIGGGLAGLTLGILLRREGVPVILYEAGKYPRHRVCGEFLSGAGRGIFSDVTGGKGVEANSAAFFFPGRNPIGLRLDEPALCLSRFEMDAALAKTFQQLGGELRVGERHRESGEGVVHATGRRRADAEGGHLIGLKAHALNASLASDLELHFAPNRYVGICRLDETRVNVCGLFYFPEAVRDAQARWKEILGSGIASLNGARWVEESFCAVAGITLDRHWDGSVFSVGDAAAMIPPLTGNGMSMAFESAAVARAPLTNFSGSKISWEEALARYSREWKRVFASRLRWAQFTQRLVFSGQSQRLFFAMARILPKLPNLLFAKTR